MAKRDLYARLDALEPAAWSGWAFRHAAATYSRGQVLNGEGARHHGGRWNPPDSFRTVYASLDIDTLVAEARRSTAPERWPDLVATHVAWRVEARLDSLVDLRPTDHRQEIGLPAKFDATVRQQLCQEIGEAAYYVRYKGMLVPSMARPEGINLVVFPDNLEDDDVFKLDPGEGEQFSDLL